MGWVQERSVTSLYQRIVLFWGLTKDALTLLKFKWDKVIVSTILLTYCVHVNKTSAAGLYENQSIVVRLFFMLYEFTLYDRPCLTTIFAMDFVDRNSHHREATQVMIKCNTLCYY